MTTSAFAQESGEKIAAAAPKCWNVPSKLEGINFEVTFKVSLSESGAVENITVQSYRPETETGKDGVRSASFAIERCAPYEAKGEVMVHLKGGDMFSSPAIDPFKN